MNKQQKYSLADARNLTPPPDPIESMRKQMAVAAFGAVREADVVKMVTELRDMAMDGNLQAMKMYFELTGVLGKNAVAPQKPEGSHLRELAEAIGELVDELSIRRAVENRKNLGVKSETDHALSVDGLEDGD